MEKSYNLRPFYRGVDWQYQTVKYSDNNMFGYKVLMFTRYVNSNIHSYARRIICMIKNSRQRCQD